MEYDKEIKSIDRHFGRLMSRLALEGDSIICLLSELVSMATRSGNGCIDLRDWAGQKVKGGSEGDGDLPGLIELHNILAESGVCGRGRETVTPLVLEDNRLYLRRYWEYEDEVASYVNRASAVDDHVKISDDENQPLNRLFPKGDKRFLLHRLAAVASIRRQFVVITGGPGTGKTTTVARILALLLECSGTGELNIALAAPTGKAAIRLQAAIATALKGLDCSEGVIGKIPLRVKTIHRLLGTVKDSPYFRYNIRNRLQYDVVVVDEVSMVDLPLMAKLVSALPDYCKVIVVGDSNQLSSVEPGSVLGDICNREALRRFSKSFITHADSLVSTSDIQIIDDGDRLDDSLVELRENFRFNAKSGIGKLVGAIRDGRVDDALEVVSSEKYPDVNFYGIDEYGKVKDRVEGLVNRGNNYRFADQTPGEMLAGLAESQVLCAVRNGPYGAVSINRLMQNEVVKSRSLSRTYDYYEGLPLMISRNDYQQELFNGDIGVVAKDINDDMVLKAFFTTPEGFLRSFRLGLLPPHEISYAITVHKSQGSEFDEVALILPDKYLPVLTRELIYTAVSRSRKKIEIWGSRDVFRKALDSMACRRGGLAEKLWGSEGF